MSKSKTTKPGSQQQVVGRRSKLWRELRDGYEAAVIRAGHSKRFAHKHGAHLADLCLDDLQLAESSNDKVSA